MSSTFIHDPSDILDYLVPVLGLAATETVTAATATVQGTGTLVVSPSGHPVTFTDSSVTFYVAAGDIGQTYDVTVHVTTNQGRQADQTIRFLCANR